MATALHEKAETSEMKQVEKKETIDFSILTTLEAKRERNQLSKRLTRQSVSFCCGMIFHYLSSAGTMQLTLYTFILLQLTLVLVLESLEKYKYTDKINVSFR